MHATNRYADTESHALQQIGIDSEVGVLAIRVQSNVSSTSYENIHHFLHLGHLYEYEFSKRIKSGRYEMETNCSSIQISTICSITDIYHHMRNEEMNKETRNRNIIFPHNIRSLV